jgi:hypothetical protein
MHMTRLFFVLLAGLFAAVISLASPTVMAEPAPIALPVINMKINDGAGGKDKLQMYGMLQPIKERHVAAIKARSKEIAAALKARLRNIKSTQLIPPAGNTEWLEKELWSLAEHMLKPIQLDGAFFKELSIE